MKVLFVGEGRHDIGDPSSNQYQPRPAGGTIPALVRHIWKTMAQESVALAWSEIWRFNPQAKRRGYPSKVAAAVLLSSRRLGCLATVVVTDRDGNDTRDAELEKAIHSVNDLFPSHLIVWGLAVESIEAWTLGAPEAIAEELGVAGDVVRQQYPRGVEIEAMSERSGKLDHRPKALLERIAQLRHRSDCTEFREAVADKTDIVALAQACPKGFKPFVEKLRSAQEK